MKKTDRKNNTNQTVSWPSNKTFFTIKTLNELNASFKEITLRVRVKNAFEDKQIVEIGSLNKKSGRPQIAFAMAPVTAEAIEAAKKADVLIKDAYDTVKIVDIKRSDAEHADATTAPVVQAETDKSTVNA